MPNLRKTRRVGKSAKRLKTQEAKQRFAQCCVQAAGEPTAMDFEPGRERLLGGGGLVAGEA